MSPRLSGLRERTRRPPAQTVRDVGTYSLVHEQGEYQTNNPRYHSWHDVATCVACGDRQFAVLVIDGLCGRCKRMPVVVPKARAIDRRSVLRRVGDLVIRLLSRLDDWVHSCPVCRAPNDQPCDTSVHTQRGGGYQPRVFAPRGQSNRATLANTRAAQDIVDGARRISNAGANMDEVDLPFATRDRSE